MKNKVIGEPLNQSESSQFLEKVCQLTIRYFDISVQVAEMVANDEALDPGEKLKILAECSERLHIYR